MDKSIELTIDQAGNVEVHVIGTVGPSCTELTRGVEDALGKVASRKPTEEFHHKAKSTQNQKA